MNTHLHTNDTTGLDDLDPAVTPAQDATHFRAIRAAQAELEHAKTNLRKAVNQARAAGNSGQSSALPSRPPDKPHTNASDATNTLNYHSYLRPRQPSLWARYG